MPKTYVGNGIGSGSQTPVVKINGIPMSLDDAEIALLGMPMTARCTAITVHDARKLQTAKGWMMVDAVGFSISFIGPFAEWQGRQSSTASPPWPTRVPTHIYSEIR